MIAPIATTIFGNEPAYTYLEAHLQSPGNRGWRRYRIIVVNRDGHLAEYREDLGAAKKFKGARQLNIPSLWEHNVDELIALGEELRYDKTLDIDELVKMDSKQYKLA